MEARLIFWLLLQLICFTDSQFNHQEANIDQEFELHKTSDEQLLEAAENLSKLVQKVILNQVEAGKELRQLKDELKLLKEKVENSELQNQRITKDAKHETQKVASLVTDLSGKINGLSEQKCDCQAISSSLVQIKESLVNVADASDYKIIQSIENGQKRFCSNIEDNIILQVKQNSGAENLNSILQLSNDINIMVQNIENTQNQIASNFSSLILCQGDQRSGNATEVKDVDNKEDQLPVKNPATGIIDCKLFKKAVNSGTLFQLDSGQYFFNNSLVSWYGARDMCHSMGMELPLLTKAAELMTLRNTFKYDYGLWVSASDIGQHPGRFRWTDGKPVPRALFLRGYPSRFTKGHQLCVFVEKGSAQLADWNCNLPMHAACYIPASLNYCLYQ